MFHRWQVILGLLVYRGTMEQPPPKYKPTEYDFIVEERHTPNTVYVCMRGIGSVPLFHARDNKHAQRLKRDHVLQHDHKYQE